MNHNKIEPYNYLKGSEFTENLKDLTKCKNFQEMAFVYDVPKSTFRTWNTHNRTSHELMVRAHLALGIPIALLALPPEERAKLPNNSVDISTKQIPAHLNIDSSNPQHDTVILKSACLSDGKLIDTGEIPYALRRINKYGLNESSVIEIETNEALYLVNQDIKSAVSGKYLVDIDGHLSINHVQRLPGKKLAVAFGDTTMEVAEEDIKIVGRVAVVLETI